MKGMKQMAKALVVAFSMYSKIPMPRFVWASEDMRYHLCFFPLVGVALAVFEGLWYWVVSTFGIPMVARNCGFLAILLFSTGGFHVDGFLDTVDARCSYQKKEKKLEILSDPHIGAFCVIHLAAVGLCLFGALSVIVQKESLLAAGACLVFSRIGSGLCVMSLPSAKKNGMLKTTMDTATKRVRVVLILEGITLGAAFLWWSMGYAMVVLGGIFLTTGWFFHLCKKEFGGITGDLAGYYVVVSELVAVMGLAAFEIMKGATGI